MYRITAIVFVLVIGLCGYADADVILNRTALDSILGSEAVTEDFESFSMGDNDGTVNFNVFLNSSTIFSLQGPGLVVDGVDFIPTDVFVPTHVYGGLQWNGKNYHGTLSKNILSYGRDLQINFWKPTSAFGFDLSVFSGYPNTAGISVFGADRSTLLYSESIPVPSPTPVFWGYSDNKGIGQVFLSATGMYTRDLLVDNVEFGPNSIKAVPEPVSTVLFSIGGLTMLLAKKRRKRL